MTPDASLAPDPACVARGLQSIPSHSHEWFCATCGELTTPTPDVLPCGGHRSTCFQGDPMLTALASTALLAQAFPGGLIGLAIIFFIIAILAYVLGAQGVAGMSAGIGRTLLFVFLVLAVIMLIVSLVNRTV